MFELISKRDFGQPKMPKPEILKGVKQVSSIEYIHKKCSCPIFVSGDDLWVFHKDYFSPDLEVPIEDSSKGLGFLSEKYLCKNKRNKFVYSDAWGSIVLRREVWIKLNGAFLEKDILGFVPKILREQERFHDFEEFELECTSMSRFWEKVRDFCFKHER